MLLDIFWIFRDSLRSFLSCNVKCNSGEDMTLSLMKDTYYEAHDNGHDESLDMCSAPFKEMLGECCIGSMSPGP